MISNSLYGTNLNEDLIFLFFLLASAGIAIKPSLSQPLLLPSSEDRKLATLPIASAALFIMSLFPSPSKSKANFL